MKPITIHERFLTFQAEGVHMGRKAYFIRTYGCPLKCYFCDSAGTWHPDFKPEEMDRMNESDMVAEVINSNASFVVITGGEPAIHDWNDFIHLLGDVTGNCIKAHLETSGAFPIKGRFDWVTLSPKRAKEPCTEAIQVADEFKLIIETPEDIMYWWEILTIRRATSQPVWLHPEWSQRENPSVLNAINDAVVQMGDPFRAGWQLHKLYHVDELDPGCRKAVPLGGGVKFEPARLPL